MTNRRVNEEQKEWTILNPRPAGYYEMPGVSIALLAKPSWWHRMWVRVLLGWTWRDA